ncbi:MAG: DUF3426 domain-containing protein [Pseudomonadales bacterium]|nr:DUF3426 domain-containing protein [Pseudomonadales bacterium]
MSEMHQTRCPHCSSVFKVSPEQLQAKNGMVRCGACLQVFRADLNLLGFGNTDPTPAAPQPPSPKKRGAVKNDDWAEKILQAESALPSRESGELRLTSTVKPIDDMARYGVVKHDDWKHQLTQPADNNTRISMGESELSDFMLDKSADQHQAAEHPFMAENIKDASIPSHADEAWAQDILDELARADNQPVHPLAKLQDPSLKNHAMAPPPADTKGHFAFGDEEALDFLNDDDLDVQTPVMNSNPIALDLTSPLSSISEPVIITPPARAWPWERLLLWGGLNTLAILLLAGQVVYFHPEVANQFPRLQPHIARFCEALHCHVAAPDNNILRVDMLIVRPDSDHGRILIDTLLHNDSNNDYPLPHLRLTMRDRDGHVLGTRVLSPADYLGESLASLPTLPPHTPVHISLTVHDPGQPIASTSLTVQPSTDTSTGN